jgi:predicted AAA+ superfamily ATPase
MAFASRGVVFDMYDRLIAPRLLNALRDTPVVLIQGARQTGKSTLSQRIADAGFAADYFTLDDLPTLASAKNDPVGFLSGLRGRNIILDEIQRAPELFVTIKAEVDRHRRPGRFLLTGSANAMLLPRLSESLTGRIELITLWPLAQTEIGAIDSHFVEAAFAGDFSVRKLEADRGDTLRRALIGGFPEALQRRTEERRGDWFESYVATLLQRDVRDLANIQGLADLPLLLALIAARATSPLNVSDLSRSARIPIVTLNRYLTLLQATYLIHLIQPWSSNLSSRLVKAPKLLMTDTGVMGHLNQISMERILSVPTMAGPLMENFVGMELIKLASWSRLRPQIFHFRTHDHREVDFVLQSRAGKVVGVEVKSASTVDGADFKGLEALAAVAGDAFACGIVLYTGDTVLPFGPRRFAVPVSALWL